MDKCVRVSDVLDWFRAYGHIDEPIPFDTLVTDLRDAIPAADVAPVVHEKRYVVIRTIQDIKDEEAKILQVRIREGDKDHAIQKRIKPGDNLVLEIQKCVQDLLDAHDDV